MKRQFRVRKHQEFDAIIKEGHFVKTKNFVIYYHRKDEQNTRIGISVSTRNGNAVKRNRIKRQVRAIIGANYELNKPLDIIIIVRISYNPDDFMKNQDELVASLMKIGDSNIETKHKN